MNFIKAKPLCFFSKVLLPLITTLLILTLVILSHSAYAKYINPNATVVGVNCDGQEVGACLCGSITDNAQNYCNDSRTWVLGVDCDGADVGACLCDSVKYNAQQYCNNPDWQGNN